MPLDRGKIAAMHRRLPTQLRALLATVTLLLPAADGVAEGADEAASLAAADAWWSQRAVGQTDGRPDPAAIRHALDGYETLLEQRPDDLEVQWKLLRARHFYGEYVLEERADKLDLYTRSRDLAEAARLTLLERYGLPPGEGGEHDEIVAKTLSGDPLAAAIYYYSAVHWGLWGETTGRLQAARAGVGGRLRDLGRMVVALDPLFEEAAGHRLLGRLHTEAPRIPWVTGWIDRDLAIEELENACVLAPHNPFNQVFLADALLRFRQSRRDEAIERLQRVVDSEPRATQLVEDLDAIAQARQLLAIHGRRSAS